MKSDRHKVDMANDTVGATRNLLSTLVKVGGDPLLVRSGTMGVYACSPVGAAIPEGSLPVRMDRWHSNEAEQKIFHLTRPGLVTPPTLTVPDNGGQTRAVIHMRDSVGRIRGRGAHLQPYDRDAPSARSGRAG